MLSIAMPVFQNVHLTVQAVENLLLTDVDFELIVVDNASTDGTAEYLESKDIRVIANSINMGIGPAIDQGFQVAKGDYLAFVCNDMIAHPSTFRKMLKVDAYCVTTRFTRQEMPSDWWEQAQKIIDEPLSWRIIGPPCPPYLTEDQMMGGFWVITRKAYEELGAFAPELPAWYGDVDMWCRYRRAGHPVVQVNTLIHHFESQTTCKVPGTNTPHPLDAQKIFETIWGPVEQICESKVAESATIKTLI